MKIVNLYWFLGLFREVFLQNYSFIFFNKILEKCTSGSGLCEYHDTNHGEGGSQLAEFILNAADFGISGDGKTDSTELINQCLSTAVSKGYHTVWFPKGHI